jgi:hypothetical protein
MKMDKKIWTIVVAVIVAVAVVSSGAFVLLTKDSGHKDSGQKNNVEIESQLQIYGNANNDYTINDNDMAIVEDVKNGDKSLDEYPLADVNCDGTVDGSDIALLQDIIDRKENIKIFVKCLNRDGEYTAVEVKYPLRNVVPYGTNIQMPSLYANGGQYVTGYFVSSYDSAESSISASAVNLEGSQRKISDAAWSNFTRLDAETGGIGAILVDYSGISQINESRMRDLEDAGIPMISYESADATAEITTVLTLGFLFGGDSEDLGVRYAQTAWDVIDTIKTELDGMSDEDRAKYICCTMYIYICGANSSFNSSAATAGGIAYASINPEFNSKYTKNSTKMASVEALSGYVDADIIINNRSMDWGLDPESRNALIDDTWNHDNGGVPSTVYFAGFLDKLVYIDNLLPGAVKLAYMAHAMYGDHFSREWADGVLQEYIDMGTPPLKGQNLDTVLAYIDKETADSIAA